MSSALSSDVCRPALDRDLAVPGVEADRDPLRIFFRRFLHQRRIAHRRGADDDAVDALAEPALDRRHVADAAAELHAQANRFENAFDRGDVHRLAGEGAVEIDDVQMLEALRLEHMRLRRRVAIEDGGARHVALLQANGQAVLEIDGGKQDHEMLASGAALSAVIAGRPQRVRAKRGPMTGSGSDPESRSTCKHLDSGFANFVRAPE